MKKKAKGRQGQNKAVAAVADASSAIQRAKQALARGEVDSACQLLAQARQFAGAADREMGARAFVAQAGARWDKPGRALDSLERAVEWAPERADLHRWRSNLFRRLGRLKLATAEMAEAARLAPDDHQITFEWLITRLSSGETGETLSQLAATLVAPATQRAIVLLAAGRGDLSAAQAAVATSPEPVDKLLYAILLLAQSQPAKAIPTLDTVVAQPNLPDVVQAYAHLYLGIAHMQRRQLTAAVDALDRAQALGAPHDHVRTYQTWIFQQLAIDAVLGSDLPAAAQWFDLLEQLGGPDAGAARANAVQALSLVGQERARDGDFKGAAEAWSEALAKAPRDTALRQNLAVALEKDGRIDEAIPHWQEIVRQIPQTMKKAERRTDRQGGADEDALSKHIRAVAHRHLADLYLEEEEVERAIEQMERALRVLPSDVDTHRDLGRLLMEEGQIRKAVTHFEQVVAAGPASAEDHLELGLAYMAVNDEPAGIEHLEKSLALEPDRPLTRFSVASALAQRVRRNPRAPTALGDAQRAIELTPPDAPMIGLIAYGAAQLGHGDRKGAQRTFRRTVKESPDPAQASLVIGHVYWEAGEREAAAKAWTDVAKKAKRVLCLYADLVEAWAKAGDRLKCQECLLASMEHSEDEAIEAVEKIAKSRESHPLLREVLRNVIASTDDPFRRVYLAEGLIYATDLQGAKALLRSAVRTALEREDDDAIEAAMDLDTKFNFTLFDRKTADLVLDWTDANPSWED